MKTNKQKIDYLNEIIEEIKKFDNDEYFFLCTETELNKDNFEEYHILEALEILGGVNDYAFTATYVPDNPDKANQFRIDILNKAIELLKNK